MKCLSKVVLFCAATACSVVTASAAEKAATKAPAPTFGAQLAGQFTPAKTSVYRSVAGRELHMDFFFPDGYATADHRPVMLAFHGGGWTGGSPRSMYPWVGWAAKQGLVGVSIQYRLFQPKGETTVFDCVDDAREAVRYIRAHANELGIDAARVIVSGSSAGGHLAAETTLLPASDAASESGTVSSSANALILLWPVLDTSKEGYGNAKIGERWRDLSPLAQVRSNVPPTLLFHGKKDKTVPFQGAQAFHEAMIKAGNRCDFVVSDDGDHGFSLADAASYESALREMKAFLTSLGYLPR